MNTNDKGQIFDIAGAIPAVGGVIQGVVNEIGRKRQMRDQQNLMDIQTQNQMKLNQQGKDLAYQQWLDTNYGAQVEQLEKAGLNAGLLYGMSGGGGTTANAGSGGSAQGGQAPQRPQMDIAGMAQLALMNAQKENIEADTENKKAEAPLKGAQKGSVEAQTAGQLTQNEINKLSKDDQIEYYRAHTSKEVAESELSGTKSGIEKTLQGDTIRQRKAEAIGAELENKAITSGIAKTEEERKLIMQNRQHIVAQIHATMASIDQKDRALTLEEQRNAIAKLSADITGSLGEQNIDLRERELIQRIAEMAVNTITRNQPKTTTTSTEDSKGGWKSTTQTTK